MRNTSLIILLIFSLTVICLAQPQIQGPQSGTLGPGTYIVVGDIRVAAGETLTIEPGTIFLHNGHHTWTIMGTLYAEGSEGDSIKFTRQNPVEEHKWGGIRFQPGAFDDCILDYCIVEYCKNPLSPYYTYGGCIFVDQVDMTISNSRISHGEAYWNGGGIYAQNANILVDHCIVNDNTAISGANGGGIFLYDCTEASIIYSVICRNSATGT